MPSALITSRLFDDRVREGDDGKRYGETFYDYLDRSGRLEAARVRDFLESSFTYYPEEERADLRSRLLSGVDRHHLGAVAELVWHEALRRCGCRIEVHPVVPGSSRRPDFQVQEPDGSRFYLESVVDTARDRATEGKRRIEHNLYDRLNDAIGSRHFMVMVSLRGPLPREPSIKRVAAAVRAWLDTLDPAQVVAAVRVGGSLPSRRFEGDGFTLDCDAMPKGSALRDRPGGIGAIWHMTGVVRTEDSVRAALEEKATRYGRLDLPYVIAVNVVCEYHERCDILDVLFGSVGARVTRAPSGEPGPVTFGRAPDGLWSGPGDGRNNGVSAVLYAVRLDAWTLGTADVLLVHNPWARLPYSGVLEGFPRVQRARDGLEKIDGDSLRAALGLPSGWPA